VVPAAIIERLAGKVATGEEEERASPATGGARSAEHTAAEPEETDIPEQ